MNSNVFALYNETKNMYAALKDAPESDGLISSVTAFTEKREEMLAGIKPPFPKKKNAASAGGRDGPSDYRRSETDSGWHPK